MKKKSQKQVNRQVLRRFAAEITRITNYPISRDTINQAIEAVEPELELKPEPKPEPAEKEEGSGEGERGKEAEEAEAG